MFFTISLHGQNQKEPNILNLDDGPYIFIKGKKLIEKSLSKGVIQSKTLENNSYDTIFYPEKSTFTIIKLNNLIVRAMSNNNMF